MTSQSKFTDTELHYNYRDINNLNDYEKSTPCIYVGTINDLWMTMYM